MEPYYTKAEQLYEVHGARGEDPTEPHASAAYPFPAVSHEPRIAQLSEDFAKAGLHPFHAPCGVRLLEENMANSRCVRCWHLRRLPLSGACQVRRGGAGGAAGARARQCDAAAKRGGGGASHQPRRHIRHRGSRAAHGRRRRRPHTRDVQRRHRGALLRRGEHGEAAARLGQRQAPQRARQRLRSGGAQLHVPQQPGCSGTLQRAQPDGVPEDAGGERLLLRRRRLGVPDGQHPDGGQVGGGRCTAARSR